MDRKAKIYREKVTCWLTAAVFFFCAVLPAPGLCDCNDCPINSSHQTAAETSHSTPNNTLSCCQPINGMEHSDDDFCSCACAKPVTPTITVIDNYLLLNNLQSPTPICFALPTASELFGQHLSWTGTNDLPLSPLPVRLHLLLAVLLV